MEKEVTPKKELPKNNENKGILSEDDSEKGTRKQETKNEDPETSSEPVQSKK